MTILEVGGSGYNRSPTPPPAGRANFDLQRKISSAGKYIPREAQMFAQPVEPKKTFYTRLPM